MSRSPQKRARGILAEPRIIGYFAIPFIALLAIDQEAEVLRWTGAAMMALGALILYRLRRFLAYWDRIEPGDAGAHADTRILLTDARWDTTGLVIVGALVWLFGPWIVRLLHA